MHIDHCPKCNSKNIKLRDKEKLLDEEIVYRAVLDCLDCGHWTDILVVETEDNQEHREE